jgi:hypothetical protein
MLTSRDVDPWSSRYNVKKKFDKSCDVTALILSPIIIGIHLNSAAKVHFNASCELLPAMPHILFRFTLLFVLVVSCLSQYHWPSPQYDALEGLLYEGRRADGSSLATVVNPCRFRVSTNASIAAEWLRFVSILFHPVYPQQHPFNSLFTTWPHMMHLVGLEA